MTHRIRKIAVLGSGLMGSGIACQFANCGFDVLMLDIVPFDLTDDQKKDKKQRNRIVQGAFDNALKSKPAALYEKSFASRITLGNFDDDLPKIADCDWVIEVVVERLDIKQQLFEKVEKFRKPGTLITSNTSGIPINLMAAGRSDDFRKNFCGTHFFNPPRYMRLLEIIPTKETDPEIIAFLMHFGDVFLGKKTVLCKDTPAFIANRVGIYAMSKVTQLCADMDLTPEDIDALTGSALGRPNTGTFRLGDLVGHDTTYNVLKGISANCPNDEQRYIFDIPPHLQWLIDNKFLGNKTGQGIYKKTNQKDASGRTIALTLDFKTLEYREPQKSKLPAIGIAKQIEELPNRIRALFNGTDKGSEFVRRSLGGLFAYVSHRIPEISDTIYAIDDAIETGFAWELGPFKNWDAVGLEAGIKAAEAESLTVADWIKTMQANGNTKFYKVEDGVKKCYDVATGTYLPIAGASEIIVLDNLREKAPVFQNSEVVLHDIGDGVLCLEFRSKANSIGEGVLKGINEAIDIAERDGWKGLVIGNNATNFSVGANLMSMAMLAYEQEWDMLNFGVKTFQDTSMRLRYSAIPVVIATQGYVFGGACEFSMHADAVVASAESYVGLVEVGVGILPGGAGTKEFALRAGDAFIEGDINIPVLVEKFTAVALGKVSTSADEAFNNGHLLRTKDSVVYNKERAISVAKQKVLQLAVNYVQKQPRKDVLVFGRQGLSVLNVAVHSLMLGKQASAHDAKIAKKIAYVMSGGDLTAPQKVSEQYLLDLEREAFMSLISEQKTLERIQYMLTNNKPLRN